MERKDNGTVTITRSNVVHDRNVQLETRKSSSFLFIFLLQAQSNRENDWQEADRQWNTLKTVGTSERVFCIFNWRSVGDSLNIYFLLFWLSSKLINNELRFITCITQA